MSRVLAFAGAIFAGIAMVVVAVALLVGSVLSESDMQLVPNRFEGDCIRGDCESGEGTFRTEAGGIYSGTFFDGLFHGRGKYESGPDSEGRRLTYVGQFALGRMAGHGEMSMRDGRRYQGRFRADLPHGEGEILWPDGRHYRGYIRAGQPDGLGTMSAPGRADVFGGWENGKLAAAP